VCRVSEERRARARNTLHGGGLRELDRPDFGGSDSSTGAMPAHSFAQHFVMWLVSRQEGAPLGKCLAVREHDSLRML
jgi:hypothetical protein